MKILAIRAKIGMWSYYVATLTFGEINEHVKRIDDELHKSKILSEALQRSITDNYKKIAEYLCSQEERFFSSIVLAMYDGNPQWREVRLEYDDGTEFYDLGYLELTGSEKIFPVDGQHRVEGIKEAIIRKPELASEKAPVIFIGHKNDQKGMERSRRVFSTLNRYAKPVSMRDIIALDEDDIVAIVSRKLLEEHPLFSENRILDSKTRAIPDSNKTVFTSLITYYECNKKLLTDFLANKNVSKQDGKKVKGLPKIKEYIRLRPNEEEIEEFEEICRIFWDVFAENIDDIKEYVSAEIPNSVKYRNHEGGNILFRPTSLLSFVEAVVKIKMSKGESYDKILATMNKLPLQLDEVIWHNILWNMKSKTMIMNNSALVRKLILYLYDTRLLNNKDTKAFFEKLDALYQIGEDEVISMLDEYVIRRNC